MILRQTDSRVGTEPSHRAPAITAVSAPQPLWPVGDAPAASRLEWSRVAGADAYRVVLYSVTGTVLFERTLSDTVAILPDSLSLRPGQSYLWKVEARTGFERWAASDLAHVNIRPDARR
jgi:hypothetical protein